MGCLRLGPRQELSGVKLTGSGRDGPSLGEVGPPPGRLVAVGLTATFPTGTLGLCGRTLSERAMSLRTAPGDSAPESWGVWVRVKVQHKSKHGDADAGIPIPTKGEEVEVD